MPVRHLEPEDAVALRDFFRSIPEQDARFLKEDLANQEVVDTWLGAGRIVRLAYVGDDDRIDAVASIAPGIGRSDHVAELRLLVGTDRRRRGIGRELAQTALIAAVRAGYRKITVEVGAAQQGTIDLFRGLGFTPEALLRDQVRADDGTLFDIVVLAQLVDQSWEALTTIGESELA
ncbi:GNAT family N-acetyltransferase [Rhodococcus sp. NPDC019627]|uniref:GNAT family N-acetyltransferase n=1 Tax=unclassified Rhodococcus (in: high G+C Gram-positive bacteria) TaxID=192944 RepID=UPI0033DCF7F1